MSSTTPPADCMLPRCKTAKSNNITYRKMQEEEKAKHEGAMEAQKKAHEVEIRRFKDRLEHARAGQFGTYGEDFEQKGLIARQLKEFQTLKSFCKEHHDGITPGIVAELARTKSELSEAKAEVERVTYQKKVQVENVKQAKAKIEDLEREVYAAGVRESELMREGKQQWTELQNVRQEALGRLSNGEDILTSLRGELTTANMNVTSLMNELGVVRVQLNEALEVVSSTKSTLVDVRAELVTSNGQVKVLKDDLEKVQTQLSEASEILSSSARTLADTRAEATTANFLAESLKGDLENVKAQLSEASESLSSSARTLAETRAEATTAIALADSLQHNLKQAVRDLAAFKETKKVEDDLRKKLDEASKTAISTEVPTPNHVNASSLTAELEQKESELAESKTAEGELREKLLDASKPGIHAETPTSESHTTPTSETVDAATQTESTNPIVPDIESEKPASTPSLKITPPAGRSTKVTIGIDAAAIDEVFKTVVSLETKVKTLSGTVKYYQKEKAVEFAKKKAYAHAIYTGQETTPLVYNRSEWTGSSLALVGKTNWLRMQLMNQKTAVVQEKIDLASPAEPGARRARGGRRGKNAKGKQEAKAAEKDAKKGKEADKDELFEESECESIIPRVIKPYRSFLEEHKSTVSNTFDTQKAVELRRYRMAKVVDAELMSARTNPPKSRADAGSIDCENHSSANGPTTAMSGLIFTAIVPTLPAAPIIEPTPAPTPPSWSFSSILGFMIGIDFDSIIGTGGAHFISALVAVAFNGDDLRCDS
ncbi:uncharacterized protein RSE6_12173 [Rhynchosporium secalis]|uniref:Uncharacterized protein n=1 Tax=Rhynchosporium secalis TaxID=38038 RepID=A0A1E1MPR6_RHYSE|nr:uncharacterized protein RSE6_12173 [Rhynchosporium secalis]